MLMFGVAGYMLRKLDYPLAPAVLAIVLGPLAEQSLRQSLLMSQGEASIFFTRPLSLMFILAAVLLFVYPIAFGWWRRRSERLAAANPGQPDEDGTPRWQG
jgi:putative tricarboxylic transport membrane protein